MPRFEEPTPERPVKFGRYELVERIGFGGMAEVFRARLLGPASFHKTVVVKRILPQLSHDPLMVRMFVEEARIAAAADHDNIAKVYELGRSEAGQYFMVMEFIDGTDLEELLQNAATHGLRVPTWFAVHAVAQTLEALSFVHGLTDEAGKPRNVIHRDATPSNIFVSHLGQVKLSDFGVADFVGKSPTTQAGQLKGKIAYMSPEQLRARSLDARADVFSVGVVLWEALTQERLFGHLNEMRAMMAICDVERPSPSSRVPDLPPRLDRICAKALALDRDDRYPSAEAFQADLLEVLHELRPPVRPRDVQAVLEQLAGRRPPAAETSTAAPRPTRDKSFLLPIEEPDLDDFVEDNGPDTIKSERNPAPPAGARPLARVSSGAPTVNPSGPPPGRDLDATDSDMLATVDEGNEPAVALEVAELRALMAQQEREPLDTGPATEQMTATPKQMGAAVVQMEISGDQTVAGRTIDEPGPAGPPPKVRVRSGPSHPPELMTWSEAARRARAAAEAGTPLEVSARGDDFLPLAELGRITGQDLSYELDPPSNVTVVGQLAKRSLTSILSRLAIDRSTGVLTVARPSDGAWYELEVHQGRPTRLISPVEATQLPRVLEDKSPLDAASIAHLCHRAIAERRPLAGLVEQMNGPDLSHEGFTRARLEVVFDWTEGDYTFNADLTRPRESLAFGGSLLAVLPELVASTWSTERLEAKMQPVLRRPVRPGPKLLTAQALFTAEQRAMLSRLVEAPVERALGDAPEPRRKALAIVYVLVEAGLAS